ncbi:MAG: hypothetical protein HYX59_14435 [Elusimicrobia bacterium]|nr:hypothetical protein [Elusimicrobiota bacterium]
MRIQGCLLTALLAVSLTAHAQTVAPDPAVVESLGLTADGSGWRYREEEKEPRILTAEQNAKVDAFLKDDVSSREKLSAWCRARGVEAKNAVAALLSSPSTAGVPAPAYRDDAAAVKEAAERGRALSASLGAAPDFDAAGHRPLDLTLRWGSAPRAEATGRNLETLYGLYGRGTDALLDKAGAGSGGAGIAARIAKAPLDLGVAWTTTLAGHELGHFEAAWLAGAKNVSWAKADGNYAFGRITEVASGDWSRMSAAGRQAFNAGGIMATQAAAAALRSSLFERGEADWSQWPLMFFRKVDMTAYGLTAPKPSQAGALDGANDMTSYARLYGERSGRGGDAVHGDIVRGAVWNMLDPMGLYSAYGYLGRYVIGGERTQKVPGVELGGRTWMAGTGFWLSEVGARYSMTVLSRGKKGDMIETTASTGEGQPAAAVRWSDDVGAGVRARLERAAAEQGPKSLGGALSVGAEKKFGAVSAFAEVGRKTTGAMLGQSHGAGTFYTIGLSGSF